MNTQILDRLLKCFLTVVMLSLFLTACKEEQLVYEIEDQNILPVNSEKNKSKTDVQYISILYTSLFRKAMSPNDMLDALNAIESIGDKQIAFDILVSKYMNKGEVILPSNEEMRAHPKEFIKSTYKRFFVRQPTEAELTWMVNYIESRPDVLPEHIYFAFATSNEHFHY